MLSKDVFRLIFTYSIIKIVWLIKFNDLAVKYKLFMILPYFTL